MHELLPIGVIAFRAGKYEDAIALLKLITDEDPNNFLAALYLALAYSEMNRFREAEQMFAKIASDCPDYEMCRRGHEGMIAMQARRRRRSIRKIVATSNFLWSPATMRHCEYRSVRTGFSTTPEMR